MTRRFRTHLLTLLITFLFLGVTYAPLAPSLDEEAIASTTNGRQGSLDVDCSGYSFEDLFEYDFALFELDILDDWATGEMYANAWVNASNSAIVRDNLDGLFEGLPGGDNDWISTDERDAVRSIGPKCIADMETRLGMREGIPHSGDVDWNDFEFVENGIALDEVNLVPDGHPDSRQCINTGANANCKEVPTSTTDDMEISLFLENGESNNVRWDQLPNSGVSNFTLAMNISNMSDAALVVTFPVLQGLRMYDFRVVDNQPASGQNCDHIGEPSFTYLPDGALRVTQLVNFDRTQWELYCDMFMDFTTKEPDMNDVPAWTASAPGNGTIVPTSGAGTWQFATAATGNTWATDEDGWALNCDFNDEGWSVSTNVLGDFFITQPEGATQSTATCQAVDPLGAVDENNTRTWTFGTLYTAEGSVDEDGKNARLTITSTGLVNEFLFSGRAFQNEQLGGASDAVVVASDPVVYAFPLQGIRPGSFSLSVSAEASNMLDYAADLSLGLTKPNSPPAVSVKVNFNGENATWDDMQQKFTMSGLVSDPDLEAVTMSLTICGANYQGFIIDNIDWTVEVSTAICRANGLTDYDVVITAVDESGEPTEITVGIPSPVVDEATTPPVQTNDEDDSDSLPSVSMMATIAMIGAALLLQRRRFS